MIISLLEDLGLTKTEIKIYLSLLKIGETTTTNIVKDANIHASKVYEYLEKLIQKGLVSYSIKNNKKYFFAEDPKNLNMYVEEKMDVLLSQKKEINSLLPELYLIQKKDQKKPKMKIFEGLYGIKTLRTFIYDVLDKNEKLLIIGAPKIGNEKLEGFLLNWHKKRIKKGIICEYLYDSDNQKFGLIRKKMNLTKVKFLKNNISSPMWIEIFSKYVAIGHIIGNSAIVFLIEDEEIANGYRDYFNLLWKSSK